MYRCKECHKILLPRRYYYKSKAEVFKCSKHGEVYIEEKYHNQNVYVKPFTPELNLYLKCKKDPIKDLLLYIEEKLSPHNEIYKTTPNIWRVV